MPYKNIKELPEKVQHALPHHGLEIYMAAYNSARSQYWRKKSRRNPEDNLEKICHKVAWFAVKEKYEKNLEGKWVEKTRPLNKS